MTASSYKYTLDTISDIRRTRRPAPVWMIIHRLNGLCWCGKPKRLWNPRMRKYCSIHHAYIWFKITSYWEDIRYDILQRDSYNCATCGIKGKPEDLQVDHIIPVARGGDMWREDNLQVLCISCHKDKNIMDMRDIRNKKRGMGHVLLDFFICQD